MPGSSLRQRLEGMLHKDPPPNSHLPLQAGESIVGHLFAKTPETGGELVLTDGRLIFAPWRFTALGDMLAAGFWPIPPDSSLSVEAQHLQRLSGALMIAIGEVTVAAAGRKASLYKPPGLLVTTSSGTVEFGILVGPYTRCWAAANGTARNSFAAAINAALH